MATHSPLVPYVARVCWNEHGWQRPSGGDVGEGAGNYRAERGFGHEEWLLDMSRTVDGWKYGFLQPVNRSKSQVEGQTIDVGLYTKSPKDGWFYVGRIHECEVVRADQYSDVIAAYRDHGWDKDMLAQVRAIGGDEGGLKEDLKSFAFNVRYKPEKLDVYVPLLPIGKEERITTLRRYNLVRVDGDLAEVETTWRGRVAARDLPSSDSGVRRAIPATLVEHHHVKLQEALRDVLTAAYPEAKVECELNFVDVTVHEAVGVRLFEVKTHSTARAAIREAIGQLLEYAFGHQQRGTTVLELVIAAPAEPDAPTAEYLKALTSMVQLPVRYVCFRPEMTKL